MNPKTFLLRQISYSGLNELNACERKFQIDKFSLGRESTDVNLAFGSAVGAGVQSLWLTDGNLDKATLATFLAWDTDFFEQREKTKKSIGHALHAVRSFVPFYELLSQEWTLAEIDGKPAIEFSLLVEFPDRFRYRAFADVLLQNKETGQLAVLELKTTGSNIEHEAMYRNSDQGTSYSLIVDQIQKREGKESSYFYVIYFSFKSQAQEWVPYYFPKTLIDKARWIKTILVDISYIQDREKENYFPMRGNNCMAFGRPCRYFEACGLPDEAVFSSDLVLQEKMEKEKEREYSFMVPLSEIVEGYLSK